MDSVYKRPDGFPANYWEVARLGPEVSASKAKFAILEGVELMKRRIKNAVDNEIEAMLASWVTNE